MKIRPKFINMTMFVRNEILSQQIKVDKTFKNNLLSIFLISFITIILSLYHIWFLFLIVMLPIPIANIIKINKTIKFIEHLGMFHSKMDYPKYLEQLKEYSEIMIYKKEYTQLFK